MTRPTKIWFGFNTNKDYDFAGLAFSCQIPRCTATGMFQADYDAHLKHTHRLKGSTRKTIIILQGLGYQSQFTLNELLKKPGRRRV